LSFFQLDELLSTSSKTEDSDTNAAAVVSR